jgi:3-phenylpropionate/trans-cinnamate dioxygenase ferredoxin subunit
VADSKFITVGRQEEVPPGEVRIFETDDYRFAVCNVDGRLFAVEDLCTHDDGPLGEGELDGFYIECPRHGAQFDVRSGQVMSPPASSPIQTYPLRVMDGEIQIEIEEE